MSYCPSVFQTKRFPTREVFVGKVAIGKNHPIRIQSMTTIDASNVDGNVEQILALEAVGCEIVRLAVQGKKQVDGVEKIKNELIKRGSSIPIVADVHFFPESALSVADFVDKVRINPGNFFSVRDDENFLERIEEKLLPLIQKCQKRKICLRLGSNSGSLSERILYRYGNTPKGMVISALEYAEICRKHDFHDLVFSMKASNPLTTIAAYRLLVSEMTRRIWDYPIHLGVTESGEGDEGRIKSSVGIGALLLDGIGDTIRVSLTESPIAEISPAKILAQMAANSQEKGIAFFEENHRKVTELKPKKGSFLFLKLRRDDLLKKDFLKSIGWEGEKRLFSADGFFLEDDVKDLEPILEELKKKNIFLVSKKPNAFCLPLVSIKEAYGFRGPFVLEMSSEEEWAALVDLRPEMIFFQPQISPLHEARKFYEWMREHSVDIPFLFDFREEKDKEKKQIYSSALMGALLCDGIGEGIVLSCGDGVKEGLAFGLSLFQACRLRMSRTEFISCPGCGRTLFDIQSIVQDLKANLSQFAGLKIAVMGCIVNGPGEMEDADFGVVGSKGGLVDLYAEKVCVEKNVDPKNVKNLLLSLIRKKKV